MKNAIRKAAVPLMFSLTAFAGSCDSTANIARSRYGIVLRGARCDQDPCAAAR